MHLNFKLLTLDTFGRFKFQIIEIWEIKIAKYSGQAAKAGAAGFILFMAILSINLGIINLFPIPLLDGGHLVFYAIEALRGRPVSEQAQEWGMRAGLALVIALMVFVTWNDIVHF